MSVCFVAEGCYPYEVGGVSSWIHSMINSFPDIEFKLIAIIADRKMSGKFGYTPPKNLVSITEVYLNDFDWIGNRSRFMRRRIHLTPVQKNALRSLVMSEDVDWGSIFTIFEKANLSVDALLMGPDFLDVVIDFYRANYAMMPFTDFLWTQRSIYLTLFLALKCSPPIADVYHCVSTGYAGIIGSMARALYPDSRLLISEHGIYTREREEEIIRAKWVQGAFKDIWIAQFRKMSSCAYDYADCVTSLFQQAHDLQLELGCPPEKTIITPNGVDVGAFENLPQKEPGDDSINVGAILRITPIKDVKTMITAFYYAQQQLPRLHLWIMGPSGEDTEYADACHELVKSLHAENIIFTGSIRTTDYIGKMDMTILTSISEGQPLTILESFAAGKPCIATNVGNCFGLIYGDEDDLGEAGIVVPVMNIPEISKAILTLAQDPEKMREMGEIGRKRVMEKYRISNMRGAYRRLYTELGGV